MYLASGLLLYGSILFGQAPDAGWFAYVPLASRRYGAGLNMDFYPAAMVALTISTTAGAVNFLVTIFKHDYDEIMENVLVDMDWGGRKARKLLLHPGRSGFMYVMDRETGELLSAEKFEPSTNWARGYDLKTGLPELEPSKKTGTGRIAQDICPSSTGAKEFIPSAFSPRTGLLYIPAHNTCMSYLGLPANYIAGTPYLGADVRMQPGPGGYQGELMAWDPVHAKKVWGLRETKLPVSVVMLALLVWLVARRTGRLDEHAPVDDHGGRGARRWVAALGFVLPGVAFVAAFVATVGVLHKAPRAHDGQERTADIRITGHQWWWEIEYRAGAGHAKAFKTANELHVPAGTAVDIALESADVIHSFWVPRLGGKVDLIPGRTNYVRVQASKPGTYQGACAEFCGLQHAKMRLRVVADSPSDYLRWLDQQSQPALTASARPAAERGSHVFLKAACPMCHTVNGTAAQATVGPDLSHVGSRTTLGAGALPKDVATLHAWIMNAPSLKPGTRMPVLTQTTGPELHDLVEYLEGLR